MIDYKKLSQTPNQEINKEEIYQYLITNCSEKSWVELNSKLSLIQKEKFVWLNVNDQLKDELGHNISLLGKLSISHQKVAHQLLNCLLNQFVQKPVDKNITSFFSFDIKTLLNSKINEHESYIEYIFKNQSNISSYDELFFYGAIAQIYNKNNISVKDINELTSIHEKKAMMNFFEDINVTPHDTKEKVSQVFNELKLKPHNQWLDVIEKYLSSINIHMSSSTRETLVLLNPYFLVLDHFSTSQSEKVEAVKILQKTSSYDDELKQLVINYVVSHNRIEEKVISSLNEIKITDSEYLSTLETLHLFTELSLFKDTFEKNYVLNEKNRLEAMMNIIEKNNEDLTPKPLKKIKI